MWRWCSTLNCRGSGSIRYSGGWRPGQQEIQCSRRVWRPVLTNMLQYSCLENPPDGEAWQATVYRVAKSRTLQKPPCVHRHETFFACGSSAPVRVEHEGSTAAWLAGTLAAPSVRGHGLPPQQELRPDQSLCLSFFWSSEGLFGLSFATALPVQALEGSIAWGPSLLFLTSGT